MPELTRRRRLLVLAVCCTSLLIAGLDVTAVNVALPVVRRDLAASISGLQWTIDGYTLAVASFLMVAGSTADRIGRRRVFQFGLALFTAGSLACSLAPNLAWLIAFRVAQGLGASMLNPVALSILTAAFPDTRERTRAIGVWSATIGLSLALGPVVGGLLVEAAGWRAVFWINVPVGLAALVATALLVPESRAATARRPDPVGQALVVAALLGITGATIESSRDHGIAVLLGVAGLGAAAALVGYERRRAQPLLDPALFRSLPFTGATVAAVAAFVALSGFLFLNTLYLQDVRGYSALHAGLLTLPMAAATVFAAPLSGRLTARRGTRTPLVAAGLLIAAAALTLISVTPTTPLPVLLLGYVLFGAGTGVVNTPITSTAVAGLPPARAGVSAAIASTGRQIGNTLGVAVLGSIVAAHTPRGFTAGGFTAAGHVGWLLLAGCGVLIAALGVLTTTTRAAATAARVPTEPRPTHQPARPLATTGARRDVVRTR